MVQTLCSQAASLTAIHQNMSSSSSNSSPSHPGCFNAQYFHCVFPATLPRCQCNILYTVVIQQPSLVANIEWQSSYEEDNSLQSLIRVFHHLCSTQIYLGSFESCTNHIVSSTLHITSALDNTLDLLHDHGFHHHILALPPHNVTLTRIFWPIYHTLSIMERDAYEESDLRTALCPTLLKLHLETPVWAYPWQRLQRLFVFTATPLGIFASTVLCYA